VTSHTRPGGRSAEVRTAVHDAVLSLLRQPDWSRVSLASVAGQAGVNPATLYRRWGSLPNLIGEVLSAQLAASSTLPDTGTLRGDVHAYAEKIAADLADPSGNVLLRAAVLIGTGAQDLGRDNALEARTAQVDDMLARARARGEPCGDAQEFFECVTGPLYGYALFAPAGLQARASILAERFLSLPQ
jgi:AcrR family transcriptional regulator